LNASERDYTPLEIKTEQSPKFESEEDNVATVEETFEESITEEDLKEEVTTMKTTTNGSEIEVITEQTTFVESDKASGETTEEGEGPMLERTTMKVDLEEITTTETIPTFEAMPRLTTTTEFPNEEISPEEATMLNEEETSTITIDLVEATTKDISSINVQETNEITKTTKKEEEDYVFTTNKQSTEKPTTVKDETVEVTTPEPDFSTEQAFANLPSTPFNHEVITNKSSPEQPSTSDPFDEQTETFTASPEETTEELSITEVTPEVTTTFDNMVREIPSQKEVFGQDSFDLEIETTTIAFDEVAATETFIESSEASEAKTTDHTPGTSISEVEITTSATDFQTTPGQLNKQVETVSTPVPGEITMIDVATKKSIMEETAPNALLEEGTSINSTPEEGKTTRDEVTSQASSTIVMTHTYVMQERKNGSWNKTDEVSNEITVDAQPDEKDDASSKLLDLVTQNFSEADNIIFDTEEIVPVKAPEDEIPDDGTTYRTEKSISKVVTEISV